MGFEANYVMLLLIFLCTHWDKWVFQSSYRCTNAVGPSPSSAAVCPSPVSSALLSGQSPPEATVSSHSTSAVAQTQLPVTGSRKAKVLYDYDAHDSSELSILADEVQSHHSNRSTRMVGPVTGLSRELHRSLEGTNDGSVFQHHSAPQMEIGGSTDSLIYDVKQRCWSNMTPSFLQCNVFLWCLITWVLSEFSWRKLQNIQDMFNWQIQPSSTNRI